MTTGRPNRARPSGATLDQIEDGGYQPRDTIRLIEDASERAAQHQGGQAVNRCPDRPFRRLHQRRSGCLAIAKTLCTLSRGIASLSASSSTVGSWPISGSI